MRRARRPGKVEERADINDQLEMALLERSSVDREAGNSSGLGLVVAKEWMLEMALFRRWRALRFGREDIGASAAKVVKALFSRVISARVVECIGAVKVTRLFNDAERDVREGT